MAHLLAVLAAYALAAYAVYEVMRRTDARIAELRTERDSLRAELSRRTDDLIEMKQRGFDVKKNLEGPKPEKVPTEVALALGKYPPELRGQAERWMRDQRRLGVDWPDIGARLGVPDADDL